MNTPADVHLGIMCFTLVKSSHFTRPLKIDLLMGLFSPREVCGAQIVINYNYNNYQYNGQNTLLSFISSDCHVQEQLGGVPWACERRPVWPALPLTVGSSSQCLLFIGEKVDEMILGLPCL